MPTVAMRLAHHTAAPALLWWCRPRVSGRGKVPGRGGVLLAANHRSFLDHFLLSAASPRPMRFLGKRELTHGAQGRLNRAMGMVAVDRGRADMTAIAEVVRLLREGEVVGVFPEGTRSTTGFLYRFRSGLGRMAAAAQAPVVPVGLLGTALVWPRGQPMPRQRPPAGILEVRFGSILGPPTTAGASRRAFTAAVRAAVAEICEQPISDDYAEIPADTGRGS